MWTVRLLGAWERKSHRWQSSSTIVIKLYTVAVLIMPETLCRSHRTIFATLLRQAWKVSHSLPERYALSAASLSAACKLNAGKILASAVRSLAFMLGMIDRVEKEWECAPCLTPILRRQAEENHAAFPQGNFNKGSFALQVAFTKQPAGTQQILIGVARDNARPLRIEYFKGHAVNKIRAHLSRHAGCQGMSSIDSETQNTPRPIYSRSA